MAQEWRHKDPILAQILKEEQNRIVDRRKTLLGRTCGKPQGSGRACSLKIRSSNAKPSNDDHHIGLALSGGGIRSATFSLGLLRALSRAKLVHSIDYLSTVSGGGYAGTFFCSLFVPQDLRGKAPALSVEEARPEAEKQAENLGCDVLGSDTGSKAISQLRQGGHYLAPNGTSDALYAAVIGLRNWFAVAITTGLALLALFLVVNVFIAMLTTALLESDVGERFLASDAGWGAWYIILAVLALWPISCAWSYWFARSGRVPRSRMLRLFSVQAVAAVCIFVLAFLWPGDRTGWHQLLSWLILATSVFSIFVYAAAEFWPAQNDASRAAADATALDFLVQEDRVRERLSRWLLRGTILWLSVAALAALHILSIERPWLDTQLMKKVTLDTGQLAVAAALGLAAMPLARWLVVREEGSLRTWRGRAYSGRRVRQIASLLLGFTLLVAFVMFWAAMAAGISRWVSDNPIAAWTNVGDRITMVGAEWSSEPAAMSRGDFVATFYSTPILKIIHAAAFFQATEGQGIIPPNPHPLLLIVAGTIALIAYLLGNVDSLLNRSSFAEFYGSRLRTAYLGATNQSRWPKESKLAGKSADEDDPKDEIKLANYYNPSVLAPIHLINVTINETTSRSSRVIQRDRKGKSMTVSPSGYLYPAAAPAQGLSILNWGDKRKDSQAAKSSEDGNPGTAEELPLSSWMAISGAAFTTGAGHHTSLGTAMLASLANVRLGYWWWRVPPQQGQWRLRAPNNLVQAYLLRELRASYEGTEAHRWYLSDGGHYENTGIYELVRRRVPLIIASDNGADRYYEFADLVNLIRKIRIDFGAEVEFIDQFELDHLFAGTSLHEAFGTLEVIRESGKAELASEKTRDDVPRAGPYATLARIKYPDAGEGGEVPTDDIGEDGEKDGADILRARRTSTLLLIKPRIAGRELPDLIQYRATNAAFPQQPTTNQFFDEAQWESYYRLGQLIGDRIFNSESNQPAPRWKPWELDQLPPRPTQSSGRLSAARKRVPPWRRRRAD